MIGGEEQTPGVGRGQEQLQTDRPLQRIDIGAVAVTEGHEPASRLAFDIHAEPSLRLGQNAVAELRHGVAGFGHGLAEHDLADIGADIGVLRQRLGDARGAGGEAAVALRAIAVELQMGQVDGPALRRLDGLQRGLDIAGHA